MAKKSGKFAKAGATIGILGAIFGSAGHPSLPKQASDHKRGSNRESSARIERIFNRRQT